MAKLRGAAKAAFLRRMALGRKRHRKGRRSVFGTVQGMPLYYKKRQRRRYVGRRRNPMSALIANPDWVPANYGGLSDFDRKLKRRKKAMAKRRRRRTRRAAPRRRRVYRRRASPRRRRKYARRAAPRRRYRRRGRGRRIATIHAGNRRTRTIYINPRRRRRYRRNPGGMVGIVKSAFVPYAVGFVTSLGSAVLDASLGKYPVVSQLVKIGGVVGIAAFVGRKHPRAAAAAIGSLAAAQGYPLGLKLAGGMVAATPAAAVKGLGEMSKVHPEMGVLLQGGLGALLNGPDNVDAMNANYQTALHNMADDDY